MLNENLQNGIVEDAVNISDVKQGIVNYKGKLRKVLFTIFSVLCFIPIGVVAIVDTAVTGSITWSIIPIVSILFFWAVVSPIFIKNYKFIYSLLSLTLFALIFLFILNMLTYGTWFFSLALPAAANTLASIWIVYFVFRFLKISFWYKISLVILFIGFTSLISNFFINSLILTTYSIATVNLAFNISGSIILAAIFFIIGMLRNNKAKNRKE